MLLKLLLPLAKLHALFPAAIVAFPVPLVILLLRLD